MARSHNLVLGVLLVLGGCAAPGGVLGPSVGSLRVAVASADAEAASRFADINAAVREDAVDLSLLKNARPSEAAFAPIIAADTAERWSAALDAVDSYLAAIQELVDDRRTTAVGADLTAIADTLGSPSFGATLPPGASGLFGSFAQALLQASAERKAKEILMRTDPAFARLMRGLADLVTGADPRTPGTLRAMVDTHWVTVLAGIENEYNKVATEPADIRRPLFDRYGAAIDSREAQRQQLAGLRAALLGIAEAHAAAARGSGGGTLFWLGQIDRYLKTARTEAAGGKE
jgi:hypothetical protein